MTSRPHEPATIEQLVAAIIALGLWESENTPEELEREARRLGSAEAYRMSVCNVLLGMVQAQAVLADGTGGVTPEQREAAWNEQLRAVGADDEHAEMFMGFLRWQALRLGTPLREIASREKTGAVPLAAAHAVDGLQGLLEVIGAGQGIITGRGVAGAEIDELPATLRAARQSLTDAVGNVNGLFELLDNVNQDCDPFTREELQSVEQELLAAAVALAPLADGLRNGAGVRELHAGVAHLAAAAATFLIAITTPGPSAAQLDSARRHIIVAVLHGDSGISRVPFGDVEGERWFLRAVAAIGELMAKGEGDKPMTEAAYGSFVTGRSLEVLRMCGAWLAHAARRR